jgi:DNA recombination protein RmuC
MTILLSIFLVSALLLAAAVLWMGWRLKGFNKEEKNSTETINEITRLFQSSLERQASLEGRIKALSESGDAARAAINERIQNQELKLSKTLEQGLHASTKKTLETMSKLESRLAVIDKAQENISALSGQVISLQDILSNKQARGAFGEIQLNHIVENVLPPSAYKIQAQLSNGRRADCLVDLPNPPGSIVIDAKFPLESYHELRNASDEVEKKNAIRIFRDAIKRHIKDIADRYIVSGETAESALMFIPSEAVYAELHANVPEAVEASHRAHVWIVSPTTLWATLTTVRAILKDFQMHEQASVIQKEVVALMSDVGRLDERVGKLQKHFDLATRDVADIRTSADKVTRRGEKIELVELEEPIDATKNLSGTSYNEK